MKRKMPSLPVEMCRSKRSLLRLPYILRTDKRHLVIKLVRDWQSGQVKRTPNKWIDYLKNETVVATATINSNLHSCICNQKWIFYDTLRLYSARLKTFWIEHKFSRYWNSYLAPRLAGMKQKKCIIRCWASRWLLLFHSPKPGGQVWILIHRKWYIDKTTLKIYIRFKKTEQAEISWLPRVWSRCSLRMKECRDEPEMYNYQCRDNLIQL